MQTRLRERTRPTTRGAYLVYSYTFAISEERIMSNNKTPSLIVLIIGVGLLLASLLADTLGVGDDPGFGSQQETSSQDGSVCEAPMW